jgi:hypothetical protein
VFRSRADAELTAKIYANAPVLIDESKGAAGNPWAFFYMTKMYDMSDSSIGFYTAHELAERGLVHKSYIWIEPETGIIEFAPLYEAKMATFYNHRAAGYSSRGDARGYRVLPETEQSLLADPNFEVQPFYWVKCDSFSERLREAPWQHDWLMGWKDIASATNERTATPVIIPRVPVGHTIRVMFARVIGSASPSFLAANMATLALDFVARQKVGGLHLTVEIIKQLPIIHPIFYTRERASFARDRVLELTYTSHALAPFARDLGHDGPPFRWDEDRRARLRAELDAFYARAYGLTRDELRYILDPADVMGPDYPSETFRVLKEKEIRLHGEYRTRRLTLEAWDRFETDGTFAGLGL